MLKHQEDTEATSPVSAPQARVTPQELSEALAAIETRRQTEASRLAGTIPIEQAVSELHLDSSPEEIWAEVQTQREKVRTEQVRAAEAAHQEQTKQEQTKQEQTKQEQARQQQFRQPQAAQWVVAPPRQKRRRGFRIFLPLVGVWTLFHFAILPNISTHHPPAVHTVHTAQMTTLAQIPDGTEAYADSAALVQLSEGKPLANVSVDKTLGDNTWTVFKRGGHVYLRGYILQTDSLQSLAGKPVNVYNSDNSGELEGEKTSAITLRVDNTPLQKSNGDADFSEVTVPNFQPDPVTTLTPWR